MQKLSGNNVPEAADTIRGDTFKGIKNFKANQNDAIDEALKSVPETQLQDIAPVLQNLESAKANYNPKAQSKNIEAIQKVIDQAKDFTKNARGDYGDIATTQATPLDVNRLKKTLQGIAEPFLTNKPDKSLKKEKRQALRQKVRAQSQDKFKRDASPEIAAANERELFQNFTRH